MHTCSSSLITGCGQQQIQQLAKEHDYLRVKPSIAGSKLLKEHVPTRRHPHLPQK
jgi:hypothetical protein